VSFVSAEPDNKPQTLMFSATVPRWVQKTARKYLRSDIVKLDLVGEGTVRTATTVEVHCFVLLLCLFDYAMTSLPLALKQSFWL